MTKYKSMSYEQLSREAQRLIALGWYKNFKELNLVYSEMGIKHHG